MVFEYHDLCWGVFGVSDGVRIQPDGFIWLGGQRRGHVVYAGYATLRTLLRDSGNFACEHRRRLSRRWRLANYVVFSPIISRSIARPSPEGTLIFFIGRRVAKALRDGGGMRRSWELRKLGRRRHFKAGHLRWLHIACGRCRRRKKAHGVERHTSMHRGDPWTSQKPACPDAVQTSGEETSKPWDLVDGERETGSRGVLTDLSREPPFDRKCAPPQPPTTDFANYDQLPYDQLHE